MKEKKKFYEQSWFIFIMVCSPLFPIGLYLAWKEKGVHIVFKIFFTCVWCFAVFYTLTTYPYQSTQHNLDNIHQKLEDKHLEDNTTIIAYISKYEDIFGEYSEDEKMNNFDKKSYDSGYVVTTSLGDYHFYIKEGKVSLVTDKSNREVNFKL